MTPHSISFRSRSLGQPTDHLGTQAIAGLTAGERARRFTSQELAELESLASEPNRRMAGEGLLLFGRRLENADRLDSASEVYASVATLGEESLAERGRQRIEAMLGQGSTGLRVEFLLRRLAGHACEPTTLLALGTAGALFRATRLATLSRLVASPTSNLLTRGFGAQALASTAGFAVEGSAFTFTGRLGSEALGRSQDWSPTAVAGDLASSYLVLGGLRLAGGASRFIARNTGVQGYSQKVFEQAGMLGGIYLGHGLEQITGLRPALPRATTWVDSLGLLLQFNLAGRLSRNLPGERFAAWERGLDQQSSALAAGVPRLGPRPFRGPELALASLGASEPARELPSERPLIAQMTGDEGGSSSSPYDQSGIRLLRELRTLEISENAEMEPIIRRWIEAQPHPIAVAVAKSRLKLPQIVMVNRLFQDRFGWQETDVIGRSVRELFHEASSNFTASRIISNIGRLMMGKSVEFDPTRMRFRMANGEFVWCIGAGIYLKIGDNPFAFGMFTEIAAETPAEIPTAATTVRPPSLTPADGLDPKEILRGVPRKPGLLHIRRSQEVLSENPPSENDPEDPKKPK